MSTPAEIQWWGWLLIWTSLVVILLVSLATMAWWLFRKSLTLADALADLVDKTGVLDAPEAAVVKPQLAVLAQIRDIRDAERARKTRRAVHGRTRRDARLARARRITTLDATRARWPAEWYGG